MTVRPPSFNTPAEPIRIGISTCLLGQNVRYDGGHKRDAFLVETFGRFVEWVPVCPEVEVGLGTPRESMRLVKDDGDVRLRHHQDRGRSHDDDAPLRQRVESPRSAGSTSAATC